MIKEDKIKAIYEKIADKTLSFGCQVLDNSGGNTGYAHIYLSRYDEKIINVMECSSGRNMRLYEGLGDMDNLGKIIGHPVMIGDVLDYYDKNIKPIEFELDRIKKSVIFTDIDYIQIGSYWTELRKPIEEQSSDCIDYIYNLILGTKQ